MRLGEVIHESRGSWRYAYFPTTSIVSLVCDLEEGASSEVALIGNEGVIGVSMVLSGQSKPFRAVVTSAGFGYRIGAQLLTHEFDCDVEVMHRLLRYAQALMTQMAQNAVCNRHHSLEQQLCRWLLMSRDRLPDNDLAMTHELIGNMLGVRREGITEAACNLQRAGLIRYKRGHIAVVDAPGLEHHVCECYSVVKREYDRLLSDLVDDRLLQAA